MRIVAIQTSTFFHRRVDAFGRLRLDVLLIVTLEAQRRSRLLQQGFVRRIVRIVTIRAGAFLNRRVPALRRLR